MSVNSDISGEAGALAALPDEGGRGCHGRKLLNRLAISRGFSAEDLNGVRLPGSANALADIGVETRSGIVCDLEFSFNIDQERFSFVLRSDSTEPRNSSRLFRSMRLTLLRKFFFF